MKYKIKTLAQRLPRSTALIKPGVYEDFELTTEEVNYQKKLKNLTEIKDKVESPFTLKLEVEDDTKPEIQEKPKRVYKTKTKQQGEINNDDSN